MLHQAKGRAGPAGHLLGQPGQRQRHGQAGSWPPGRVPTPRLGRAGCPPGRATSQLHPEVAAEVATHPPPYRCVGSHKQRRQTRPPAGHDHQGGAAGQVEQLATRSSTGPTPAPTASRQASTASWPHGRPRHRSGKLVLASRGQAKQAGHQVEHRPDAGTAWPSQPRSKQRTEQLPPTSHHQQADAGHGQAELATRPSTKPGSNLPDTP